MIRVARLIPFFSRQHGGPATHILELTRYLSKYPIKTTVYTSSELDYYAKIRTHPIQKLSPKLIIKRFNSYLRFRDYRVSLGLLPELLRDSKNIDIFHSHAPRSFQEDIAALIAILKNKKLVITSHGILNLSFGYFQHFYERLKDFTTGFIERKLLDIKYVAVTKLEAEFFKRFGIPEENIHIIPHGIDINQFKPADPSQLVQRYGLQGKKVILFVGRIYKEKRIDLLIEAFNLLKDEIPESVVVIVGGDYGYQSTLESLIKKYNIQKRVLLLGFVPKFTLPKVYNLADVVVMPAKSETFGHVALEANACEKVAIASNHWGPREIIENGKTGFLIEFGDIEDMKEKIVAVLENEDETKKMGKFARKYVRKNFSWEYSARKHYELYKGLLYD